MPCGHLERYALFQSTLSVRRATDAHLRVKPSKKEISIHALREESDLDRLPRIHRRSSISIHALREESDSQYVRQAAVSWHFNPRSP